MKKLFLFLLGGSCCLSAVARQPAGDSVKKAMTYHPDSMLSHWVVDINLLGGGLSQKYTTANTSGNYPGGVNMYTGNLKVNNGSTFGFDAQLAYFFGHSNHFGIGVGFNYLYQSGNATLDSFHAEYQATDAKGNIYRQVVTSDQSVKEKVNITNMNIPILLKYKNRFSKHWGFTADAGALINLQVKNSYNTNAAFDYEAIYQYNQEGVAVYDNSAIPSTNDQLITKAQYYKNTTSKNVYPTVQDYFKAEAVQGYNVSLGVKPTNNSGSVSFTTGSVGLLVRPAVNYYLSDKVALTAGVFYIYQPFKNPAQNGYELTNGMGNYSSVLHTVTSAPSQSYGLNVGARFYVFKTKDTDGDGIRDKRDRCPLVYGLPQFQGCPDTDGDGIADPDDSCPTVAGLLQFHGCPDTDGDGIPDKDDACPYQAGPAKFQGCPDRDNDGILDKDDACPDVPGLAQFQGCPDTDGDGTPDKDDKCPTIAGPASNGGCPVVDTPKPAPVAAPREDISKPILFEVNKTIVHKKSIATLEEAAQLTKDDPNALIIVDGYTDNTGRASYNKKLSLKRAKAVKAKLEAMGVNRKRIKVKGHGSKYPVASNRTKAGRLENRRAVMHLNVSEQ
jgi:outer membrane protein OmpA-like peptidoglycan-associated protein